MVSKQGQEHPGRRLYTALPTTSVSPPAVRILPFKQKRKVELLEWPGITACGIGGPFDLRHGMKAESCLHHGSANLRQISEALLGTFLNAQLVD